MYTRIPFREDSMKNSHNWVQKQKGPGEKKKKKNFIEIIIKLFFLV